MLLRQWSSSDATEWLWTLVARHLPLIGLARLQCSFKAGVPAVGLLAEALRPALQLLPNEFELLAFPTSPGLARLQQPWRFAHHTAAQLGRLVLQILNVHAIALHRSCLAPEHSSPAVGQDEDEDEELSLLRRRPSCIPRRARDGRRWFVESDLEALPPLPWIAVPPELADGTQRTGQFSVGVDTFSGRSGPAQIRFSADVLGTARRLVRWMAAAYRGLPAAAEERARLFVLARCQLHQFVEISSRGQAAELTPLAEMAWMCKLWRQDHLFNALDRFNYLPTAAEIDTDFQARFGANGIIEYAGAHCGVITEPPVQGFDTYGVEEACEVAQRICSLQDEVQRLIEAGRVYSRTDLQQYDKNQDLIKAASTELKPLEPWQNPGVLVDRAGGQNPSNEHLTADFVVWFENMCESEGQKPDQLDFGALDFDEALAEYKSMWFQMAKLVNNELVVDTSNYSLSLRPRSYLCDLVRLSRYLLSTRPPLYT